MSADLLWFTALNFTVLRLALGTMRLSQHGALVWSGEWDGRL